MESRRTLDVNSRCLRVWIVLLLAAAAPVRSAPSEAPIVRILVLGDSITLGENVETRYSDRVQENLGSRFSLSNRALNGVSALHLIQGGLPLAPRATNVWDYAVAGQDFDTVTLMLGTNCSFIVLRHGNCDSVMWRKAMESILNDLSGFKNRGGNPVDIVLMAPPVPNTKSRGMSRLTRTIRAVVSDLCAKRANVTCRTDPYETTMKIGVVESYACGVDWIHPCQEFHDAVAEQLTVELRAVTQKTQLAPISPDR